MADNEWDIPEDVEKVLFAEDLVSYVMLSYDSSFELFKTAENYRDTVYNAFNETVRDATDFLISQFHQSNALKYEILRAAHLADESTYRNLISDLGDRYFGKGFDARRFLYFCAQISSMAGIFYSSGTHGAPYLAVSEIVDILEEYPMKSGAWNTVNTIAEEYCRMALDCDYRNNPVDSLKQDENKTHSPVCDSPVSVQETPEDEFLDYHVAEKEILKIASLDGFIDVQYKEDVILLITEDLPLSEDDHV